MTGYRILAALLLAPLGVVLLPVIAVVAIVLGTAYMIAEALGWRDAADRIDGWLHP